MLSRLADRLILRPTKHPLKPRDKHRFELPFQGGRLELWRQRQFTRDEAEADVFVVKFPGTKGRAELATVHPAEFWSHVNTELWTVNLPGYGGSSGRASLKIVGAAARAAFDEVERIASGRPILITGNSLGAAVALHVAAERAAQGLLVRNVPPLREVILGRFRWWPGARLIARQVPGELDAIHNANRVKMPGLFVVSAKDRVVPPQFQQRVIDAFGGEKRIMTLAESGHDAQLVPGEELRYRQLLGWLYEQVAERADADVRES